MGPEITNRIKDSEIGGDFVGRDKISVNIIMFQDKEREFVVTENANIKPVAYFTGRETELRELRKRIEEGRKSILVSGMGGIGKTHICRKLFEEYVNRNAADENRSFRHLGYIEYNGDMGSSLQNCLKFRWQDDPKMNQEAAWRELEYLASDGKLLLFVDNVNKPVNADLGLQRLKGIPGAVILTSRQASFSDEFQPYRIGFLEIQQCKEIYEKIRFRGRERKVRPEEVPELEYIIESLAGKHTITIELLAHLARTKIWTVKELRDKLEQNGFRMEFHKDGELVNIQDSYEALYNMSGLTEAEQNILEAFSIFPYIPLAAKVCNEWLLEDASVSEDDDILMRLYEKGWLEFDIEQESYAMHPVFAQFIHEKCKPEAEKHSGLVQSCEESLKIPKNGSPFVCQQYLPFAESIVKKLNFGEDMNQIIFIDSIAYLLWYISEYKKAEEYYKRSLRIVEKVLGEEHPDTAISYNNLALLYESQGEYGKSEEYYKRSLRIIEKVLGEEHPDAATSYNNLAILYESQGEYGKAEEYYKRSLRIREKVLGEEHPDAATSYNNLAILYESQGEYGKAEEYYKRSLRIREKVLGEEHPDAAISYNNLALLYESQREFKIALTYYLNSYTVLVFKFGINHPHTQIVYKNMKMAYHEWDAKGDFEQWLEENMKKSNEISK